MPLLKDALLVEYDHETATTRKLLERIPDDRLAFLPHARSMTLGSLATHLATIPLWADTVLNAFSFYLDAMPARPDAKPTSADILRTFDETSSKARSWMDRTDAELVAPWTLKRGDQDLFTLPRVAAFRTFVLNHLIHHRGQLSVYLRLNDVPIPAMYGPSADEG